MTGSKEWWEFHLTPNGWVRGSEQLAAGAKQRPVPTDRLLTIRQHEHAPSRYARPLTWSAIVWRHGDTKAITTFREQFGNMPPGSERFPFK